MAVFFNISMSLDGFVAGPNASLDDPLGEGGERLHEWAVSTRAFNEGHGRSGGETGPDNDLLEATFGRAGATIVGRRMFSGGEGPWEDDPNPNGWWGDEPPFHHPVFVLTHHEREPLELIGTTFTFVTDGIESALEQARAAAGDKDVAVGGGADVAQQYLNAGLLDEIDLHVAPIMLGDGVRLFDRIDPGRVVIEPAGVAGSPAVTHLSYRVAR